MDATLQEIPGYHIRSLLGEGGFAKVYLARQISLDRDVALKVMDPAMSSDREFCERFLKEGRDTAVLSNHPNVVTVYDIGRVGDRYYIAMEYLPGANLKELLDREEPYQHPLHIIKRIASALAYAHSKGFVHRDIKPANILFNEADEAVLSDFGIAKTLNKKTSLTAFGSVIGTASYMSPEQAKGLDTIDGRSDIYSLGVVFYELLTRSKPYTARDPMSLMLKHVNDPVPQLPEPEQIYQPVLDRMMAKDPGDRYPDGYALIEDLDQRYFSGNTMTSGALMAASTGSSSTRWLMIAAGILSVIVGVGYILTEKPFGNDEPEPRAVDPSPPSSPKDDPPLNQRDQEQLIRLLEIAELHEAVGRITEPPGSNAVEAYSLVLELDPGNAIATKALTRLRKNQ